MPSFKIGPISVPIPTFFRPPPPPPVKMPQGPIFNPDQSSFTPYAAPPMSIPQPPQAPPKDPVAVMRPVFDRLKDQLPGLKAGASPEARKAAVDVLRDAMIGELNNMGVRAQKHVKGNGEFSNDAFDVIGPDGQVQVIDFLRASKDVDRDVTADNVQWLDVTHGGGAAPVDFGMFDALGKDDPFLQLLRAISAGKPGLKKGATPEARKAALGEVRDEFIKQGNAAGMNLSPNVNEKGEVALDSVLQKLPDGSTKVLQIAPPDALDTSKSLPGVE